MNIRTILPECLLCKNKCLEQISIHNVFGENIYYCSECGFGFCWPMPDDNTLRDYYLKEYYRNQEEKFSSYFYVLKSYKYAWSRFQYLSKFIQKNIRVLDIGCSFGSLLEYFQDMGAEVFGTEASRQPINNISSKLDGRIKEGFDFFREYPSEQFDLIILSHVLEHFNNPYNLDKCCNMLKENGLLFVEVPNEGRIFLDYRKIGGFGSHLMWFTHNALERLGKILRLELIPGSTKTYNVKKGFMDFLSKDHPLKSQHQQEWRKKEWGDSFEKASIVSKSIPDSVARLFFSPKNYAKLFRTNYFSSSKLGGIIRVIYKKSR